MRDWIGRYDNLGVEKSTPFKIMGDIMDKEEVRDLICGILIGLGLVVLVNIIF
jgi:hypothetical protein